MVSNDSKTSIKNTAELLGLQPNALTEALTSRSMRSAGESSTIQYVNLFLLKNHIGILLCALSRRITKRSTFIAEFRILKSRFLDLVHLLEWTFDRKRI